MLSDRREVLLALHRHVVGGAAGSGGAGGDGGGLKPESAAAAATASAATASCMASLSGGVMDVREPRLRPMIAWCAARAREKFCGAAASEEGLQEEWESATLASTTTAPISTLSTQLSSAASSASLPFRAHPPPLQLPRLPCLALVLRIPILLIHPSALATR